MPYEESSRYNPHTPIEYDAKDEQGFIDDDNDDEALLSLSSLGDLRLHRRQQYCVSIAIILTIIGSCIALGLGVTKPRRNETQPIPANGVIAPPPNFEVTCAPMNIKTNEGYSDCLHMCEPAQCCSLIGTNPFSCLEGNRDHCETYRSSCQHLDHKKASNSSKLHTSVETACNTDALKSQEGVNTCESMCKGFSCCFDDSTNCDISTAWCHKFGACSILFQVDEDGFNSHAEAKAVIDSACKNISNYSGQTACSNICQLSLCCFVPDFVLTKQCMVTCDHYEACQVLYGLVQPIQVKSNEEHMVSISVPQQVERACAPAQFQELSGIQECMDICQHHLCCFQSNGCLLSNPDECQLYSACRQLTDLVTPLSEPPEQACSVAALQTDGPAPCVQACSSHLCCWIEDRFASSCARDELCSGIYAPCHVLAPTPLGNEDANLLERVETTCTKGNLESMLGVSECHSYCIQRECCFQDGAGNCELTDISYCSEVKKCHRLKNIKEQVAMEKEKKNNRNETSTISKQIANVCNVAALTTLAGFHNCYDQCYYHLCCFVEDPLLNCKEEMKKECLEYIPCAILFESPMLSVSPERVSTSCAAQNVETKKGLQECHLNCAQHLCCFQDPNLPSSCTGLYGESQCASYNPCSILVGDSAHSVYYSKVDPYLEALINNYCSEDNLKLKDGILQCSEQCDKRSCCFGDDNDTDIDPCFETDKEWCAEAAACKNLHVAINSISQEGEWENNATGDAEGTIGNDDDKNTTMVNGSREDPGGSIVIQSVFQGGEDDDNAPGDSEAMNGNNDETNITEMSGGNDDPSGSFAVQSVFQGGEDDDNAPGDAEAMNGNNDDTNSTEMSWGNDDPSGSFAVQSVFQGGEDDDNAPGDAEAMNSNNDDKNNTEVN